MKIITDLAEITEPFHKACVTIGNFDGVHQGHQYLFSEVQKRAYSHGGTSVAITFMPHPLLVVHPEACIKLISTCEQKRELIELAGIDILIIIPFTKEFAKITAEDFVNTILLDKIGMKELIVGYDYCFGKGREGTTEYLKAQGKIKGFPVTVMDPFYVDGIIASSTQVRKLVKEGNMRAVRKLQGRYYQIRGEVQLGHKRGGAELGFPTANLHIEDTDLCPKHGVYVTQVIYEGKCYGGVLNIGVNPTFSDGCERITAETFIFDFNEDIYGKPIKINLLRHLRGEKKFSGPAELVSQIKEDIEQAKTVLLEASQEIKLSCEEKFNH
jgi:riboflavin kinase/FMN adenylyltransferase